MTIKLTLKLSSPEFVAWAVDLANDKDDYVAEMGSQIENLIRQKEGTVDNKLAWLIQQHGGNEVFDFSEFKRSE